MGGDLCLFLDGLNLSRKSILKGNLCLDNLLRLKEDVRWEENWSLKSLVFDGYSLCIKIRYLLFLDLL